MLRQIGGYVRRHHVALLALFFALGGTSFAAASALLPRNSVGSAQVINNSLLLKDFKKNQRAKLRGPRGYRGPKGDKGDRGETGPPGAPNPNAINAQHATLADQATLAQSFAGRFTSLLQAVPGPLPRSATFTSSGRPLLFEISGSGFAGAAGSLLAISASIDGVVRGEARGYTNESGSHKALAATTFVVTGLARGSHTLTLTGGDPASGNTQTDYNDFFSASVLDLPTDFALAPEAGEPNDTRATATWNPACAFSGRGPYFVGTVWPAGNDDWVFENCKPTTGNVTLTLIGGPTMDIFPYSSSTPIATNVVSYTAPADFYYVRVHAPSVATYTLIETKEGGVPVGPGSVAHD